MSGLGGSFDMSRSGNAPRNVTESDEYVNPFQDVHRKAKARRERAEEDRKKLEEIRKERLTQEPATALKRQE